MEQRKQGHVSGITECRHTRVPYHSLQFHAYSCDGFISSAGLHMPRGQKSHVLLATGHWATVLAPAEYLVDNAICLFPQFPGTTCSPTLQKPTDYLPDPRAASGADLPLVGEVSTLALQVNKGAIIRGSVQEVG